MTTPATPVTPVAPVTPVTPVTPAEPTSVVSTPPTPTPTPTSTPDAKPNDPKNIFAIPEPYAKEPWAQGLKSLDDVFNQHANAQKLIGKKRIALPSETSSPEEVAEFRKALGVPETPDAYDFKVIEPLKDLPRDTEIDNFVKKTLHKHGVPKDAGEKFVMEMEQLVFEHAKPRIEAVAKQEKAFAELKKNTFGDKVEETSAVFEKVMEETLKDSAPQLMEKLKTLPQEARLASMAFAKAIHDKYVGEHKIVPPVNNSPTLSADLKTAYQQLSQSKLAVRSDNSMPAHVKEQRIAELNKQMQAVGAKAQEQNINLFS